MSRTELFSTARPNITKIGLLITDGEATREAPNTVPEANRTKELGVEVFTVGITSEVRASVCLSVTAELSIGSFCLNHQLTDPTQCNTLQVKQIGTSTT